MLKNKSTISDIQDLSKISISADGKTIVSHSGGNSFTSFSGANYSTVNTRQCTHITNISGIVTGHDGEYIAVVGYSNIHDQYYYELLGFDMSVTISYKVSGRPYSSNMTLMVIDGIIRIFTTIPGPLNVGKIDEHYHDVGGYWYTRQYLTDTHDVTENVAVSPNSNNIYVLNTEWNGIHIYSRPNTASSFNFLRTYTSTELITRIISCGVGIIYSNQQGIHFHDSSSESGVTFLLKSGTRYVQTDNRGHVLISGNPASSHDPTGLSDIYDPIIFNLTTPFLINSDDSSVITVISNNELLIFNIDHYTEEDNGTSSNTIDGGVIYIFDGVPVVSETPINVQDHEYEEDVTMSIAIIDDVPTLVGTFNFVNINNFVNQLSKIPNQVQTLLINNIPGMPGPTRCTIVSGTVEIDGMTFTVGNTERGTVSRADSGKKAIISTGPYPKTKKLPASYWFKVYDTDTNALATDFSMNIGITHPLPNGHRDSDYVLQRRTDEGEWSVIPTTESSVSRIENKVKITHSSNSLYRYIYIGNDSAKVQSETSIAPIVIGFLAIFITLSALAYFMNKSTTPKEKKEKK